MSIFLGNSEPSKIFVGGSEVASVRAGDTKVRPTSHSFGDTITVTWTEAADPAQFNPVWSDGAKGAVAGDTKFDEWFGYSGVRLNDLGVVTAEITQEDSGGAGNLDITQLGTLTSGDNVMIKFPVRGIKMSKEGSTVTLSMTKDLNKSGYQYYAFNDNGTTKNNLCIGAYKGTFDNGKLKSLSGLQPQGTSLDGAAAAANTYGGNYGYHEISWYARQYMHALFMMKYGNPDAQTIVGMGLVSGGNVYATGATNSIITATGATNTSNTGRIKLFGVEDWWGNLWEWLDGAKATSYSNQVNVSTSGAFSSTSRVTSFDATIGYYGAWRTSIQGDNYGMFSGKSGASNYCDNCVNPQNNSRYFLGGGDCYSGSSAGLLKLDGYVYTYGFRRYGCRLMYLG